MSIGRNGTATAFRQCCSCHQNRHDLRIAWSDIYSSYNFFGGYILQACRLGDLAKPCAFFLKFWFIRVRTHYYTILRYLRHPYADGSKMHTHAEGDRRPQGHDRHRASHMSSCCACRVTSSGLPPYPPMPCTIIDCVRCTRHLRTFAGALAVWTLQLLNRCAWARSVQTVVNK